MAVITVTGDPACRAEDAARLFAQRAAFEFLAESHLRRLVAEEYGSNTTIPDRAWPAAVTALLARLARAHHLVVCCAGAESLAADFPSTLRVAITAPEKFRVGALMLDHHLDRPAAHALLGQLDREHRSLRRRQFGRSSALHGQFDLSLNAESFDPAVIAELMERACAARGLLESPLLAANREAEIEFQARLKLARHGITPASRASLARRPFANDSEQIFANLLDYYRIAWEYEPKSFPIQWDKDARPLESFTPDFYLPEFDLYIELTTMKQANVTRKNRKIKLLRSIYPHVNIQVFYQKDFQNLVFKYGLAERVPA